MLGKVTLKNDLVDWGVWNLCTQPVFSATYSKKKSLDWKRLQGHRMCQSKFKLCYHKLLEGLSITGPVHICIYQQHNKMQTLGLKDKVSTLLYLFKAKIITLLTTGAPLYEYHKWSPLLYNIFVIYHLASQCPNIWVKFHKGAFWQPELSGLSCLW